MTTGQASPTLVADRRAAPRAEPALVADDRWLVAGLAGLALVLRLPNLGRGYWIDEGISVGIATHPLREIPRLLRQDGSPPLFYVVLHFWTRMFGTTEIATHVLPLVISLIAVPIAYWAGSTLFGRTAGLAAAALMSTNPFMSWYSTETRMYTLVVVLAMAAMTFSWRAMRERHLRDAVLAVACFAALLYTHDWAIYLTLVTAGVLAGVALFRGDRRLAWQVGASAGAAFALSAPWLPSFIEQARNTAAPWSVSPGVGDFFADPASALGGTIGFLVAPLLAFGALRSRRERPASDGQLAGLLCGVAVLTLLAAFLGAQLEPSWTVRYMAIVVGPFLLAAAGAMASTSKGRVVIITTCVLLAGWSAVSLALPNPNASYAKSNVAAVAGQAAPHLRPGDVVVVTETEQVPVLAHYLPAGLTYVTPTGPVSDDRVVDWRNLVDRLQDAAPCAAVAPSVDSLPLGASVLVVDPARKLGSDGSAWSTAVTNQVHGVDELLAADQALTATDWFGPALHPQPFSPVVGLLYSKTSGASACG